MRTLQEVEYEAQGVMLRGFLADGSGSQTRPGVLVCHESPGLTDHAKRRAQALADEGYVAFALDLYGARDLNLEEARRHSAYVFNTSGVMFARAKAALDAIARMSHVDPSKLAAVGFCLGGVAALELARGGAPIRCAIGCHPSLKRAAGSVDGPISAKILMMVGDEDPVAPLEDRLEFARSMTQAKADWQLHVFGGVGHSYTSPAIDAFNLQGFRYNASADRRSWAMTLSMLAEAFGE